MDIPDWQIEGTMEHAQYQVLKASLNQAGYKVAIAAASLRVGRSTVYRLMRRYGIDVPDKAEESSSPITKAPSTQAAQHAHQPSRQEDLSDVIFDGTNYLLRKR